MIGLLLQIVLFLFIGVLIGRLWEEVTRGSRAVLTYRVGDEVTRVVAHDPNPEVVRQAIKLLTPEEAPIPPMSPGDIFIRPDSTPLGKL